MARAQDSSPAPAVEVSIELDVERDRLVAALEDPELLSAWLGAWEARPGEGEAATVHTDDGLRREVSDRRWVGDELRWTWRDASRDDGASSHVAIRLEPTDAGATRLVVTETLAVPTTVQASARVGSPLLESATWLASLLALGAVLAASSLARV